jgi:hypothetical protein
MHTESQHVADDEHRLVQRAIILHLLRDDHAEHWTPAELQSALRPTEPLLVAKALAALEGDGVLHATPERIWASRAARRLDGLGLIAA